MKRFDTIACSPNLLWSILGFRGICLNISSINVKFQGGSHHTQWGFKSKVIKINQRLFHVSVYPLAFTPLRRWSQVRRTSQKRRLFNFRQNLINYGASILGEHWRERVGGNGGGGNRREMSITDPVLRCKWNCSRQSTKTWQTPARILANFYQVNFLIRPLHTSDVPSTQSPHLSPKMIHKVIYFPEFLMRILGEQKKIVNATS